MAEQPATLFTIKSDLSTRLKPVHFTPWADGADWSCWTCAHSTGYDGEHLWCEQHSLVLVAPCGWWERGAGCDEPER